MNGLYWCGSSLDDLRAFPKTAKISLGREIDRLERGALPSNYKPLKNRVKELPVFMKLEFVTRETFTALRI